MNKFETCGNWIPKWISVKDRLPEVGEEVLLWMTRAADPWRTKSSLYDMGVYNPEAYQPFWEYVAYWMPLPEPPKEDDYA